MNERTLSVELRTDDGDNMNELFLSQDIRNLNPRLPHDGEAHLVKLTNVSPEGVLSLQISGPGLTSLGEVSDIIFLDFWSIILVLMADKKQLIILNVLIRSFVNRSVTR